MTPRQSQITRSILGAMDALQRRGHAIKAVRVSVDGEITVLTNDEPSAPVSNDLDDWVSLAGKKAIPRA